MSEIRIRQICLVAHDLAPIEQQLASVFGLEVAYRDPVAHLVEGKRKERLPVLLDHPGGLLAAPPALADEPPPDEIARLVDYGRTGNEVPNQLS